MRTRRETLKVRMAWKPAATAKCKVFKDLITTLTIAIKIAESVLRKTPMAKSNSVRGFEPSPSFYENHTMMSTPRKEAPML